MSEWLLWVDKVDERLNALEKALARPHDRLLTIESELFPFGEPTLAYRIAALEAKLATSVPAPENAVRDLEPQTNQSSKK